MDKNLIFRKRHLLTIPMLLMVMCLGGCATQLTVDTYTHEAGEELPEDPFTVEVVDTTAPSGTIAQHFITTTDEIKVEDFVEGTEDCSEFTEGIRNLELIYDEDQVRELMERAIGDQVISEMKFDIDKIFDTNWDDVEAHFWEEKDVSSETLEKVMIPEADGVYSMEVVAVDIYGNATVAKVYVMVDTKAPVFTLAEDIEVIAGDDFYEYLEAQEEGIAAEDNLVGDMTTAIYVERMELADSNDTAMKITYAVNDFAGNTASVARTVTVKSKKETSGGQSYTASTLENVIITEGNVHNTALCLEGLNKIPANIVNKFLAGGWHIILTENSLGENIGGSTYWSNHTIVIPDNQGSNIPTILVHEMGHFLGGSTGTPWKSAEFAAIWAEEKDAFAATGGFNGANAHSQMEFFSQVFCDIYTTGYAQTVAPKAYAFVLKYATSL